MCNLLELGFTYFPKMFVFKGDKLYQPKDIVSQLGLINKNDPRVQVLREKLFNAIKRLLICSKFIFR